MNNVHLCIGSYAKKPFYVNLSDIYLYSIEELCYYFIDKIFFFDYDIVSQELVDWIRTECGMQELADELDIYIRKHVSAAAFVTTILEKTAIYDENIIRKVDRFLKEQAELSAFERLKKRAEYFYQTGKFRQALGIYMELLAQTPKQDIDIRAMLFYNMASVYAMNFEFELAAEYYFESYRLAETKQTRQAYILAKRKAMTDFDFGNFKREHAGWWEDFDEVEQSMLEAEEAWINSKQKALLEEWKENVSYNQEKGDLIQKLKEDYRRQTM
ncbi:MAG: hypothetical protein IJC02_09650 [Lachnospiraceae bacterium]|nr:hypothetical protein [Lachnospiraceae bacterium]